MQSNETYCIYQTKMIMHFTCQRSDAKFTVREAGLRAHCLTLLYFPQQVSHVNFVRIVTRNVLCSHRSSVVWIVVGVTVALWQWLLLSVLHWCDDDNANVSLGGPGETTPSSWPPPPPVYRVPALPQLLRDRVHQTLIVCWRPLWVRLEPKNMKSK